MKKVLAIIGAAMLSACLNVADPPDEPTDPATETFAENTGVNLANMTKTATGVYYQDLEAGSGLAVSGDQWVSISYVGYLKTGYSFDRSTQPTAIRLGQGIVGFAEGMIGMKVGGTRKIVIPSQRAYGAYGFPAYGIPPNSTLIYDVHLYDLP